MGWFHIPLPRIRPLTESRYFEKAAKYVFDSSDVDSDGCIDQKELYIALLKLYDKLNAKLPVHIKIPKIEEVNGYVARHDFDKSGALNYNEFLTLSKNLIKGERNWFDSLTFKIILAVSLKWVGFPLVGQGVKSGLSALGVPGATKVPTSVVAAVAETTFNHFKP